MSQPYVGEIRLFAGNFAPAGWLFCDGSILSIAQNETLFQVIGTTYGGDGQSTFALPDLRGRVPLHQGQGPGLSNRRLGESAGSERLTAVPAHSHNLNVVTSPASSGDPGSKLLAASRGSIYTSSPNPVAMSNQAIASPVLDNNGQVIGPQVAKMPPYVGINHIISLFGIFPSPA
jgi:microcystin-dependent protein